MRFSNFRKIYTCWIFAKAMRNDSLIFRGLFYNFIFDTNILNLSSMNPQYPGPGINYSECIDNCREYHFSTRPMPNDVALIKNFLVPQVISQDRYEPLAFHADISFDFTKMDFWFQLDFHGRTASITDCSLLGNNRDPWSVMLSFNPRSQKFDLKFPSIVNVEGRQSSNDGLWPWIPDKDNKNPLPEWRQKDWFASNPVLDESWNIDYPVMNDREGLSMNRDSRFGKAFH